MKKKIRLMALLFFIATFTAAMITACKPVETKYRVTFIANDVIVSTMQSAGNEEISLPTAPNVDGFTFKGWFLDPDIWEEPFDGNNFADKPITAEVNVYAKYEKMQPTVYLVEFDTDGGSAVSSMTVSVIETSPYTEKSGYQFVGWYKDADRT